MDVRLDRVGGPSSPQARVIVRDTGQGIPKEFLPYVFERYRQAGGAAATRRGGLGLGWAIVHLWRKAWLISQASKAP